MFSQLPSPTSPESAERARQDREMAAWRREMLTRENEREYVAGAKPVGRIDETKRGAV